MEKLTTEEFIKKAQAVHGDKYDYSKVEYVNASTKVCIICNEHGEFWQKPGSHMSGHGCTRCASDINAAKMRVWTEEKCREVASRYSEMKAFRIESKDAYNAAMKHNWLKDYTWLAYKIDISKKSKQRHIYTQEEIIERLRSIFGDRYSYEKVEYKAMKVPITLVCHEKDANGIEHGDFAMRPDNIFSGKQGCPKCWSDRRGIIQRIPIEEFISRAKSVHGNKYEYHKVDYFTTNIKVCIVCPIHGDFWQTPSNHLKGKGCPYCSGNAKKWNKQTCEEEAKKYEYIFDFRTKSPGACNVANHNGWLKEYTWLKRLPPKSADYDKNTKYIYAYEFASQKAVYVGLTNSMIKRDWQHRNSKDSSVYRFAEENGCDIPSPKQLERSVPVLESGKREKYWVESYKVQGWHLLNRAKTGERESSVGIYYPIKWNKKAIKEKAKECEFVLTVFAEKYPGAYEAIQSRYKGLLNELFPNRMIHTHHTVEDALLVVNKGHYDNRSQLRYGCLWAYRVLFDNGLLDEVFGKSKEYTKEEALIEADEYKSIEQIRLKNHLLWNYLRKNNLFREAKPADPMFHHVKTIKEAWNLSQYYRSMTELRNHAKVAYRLLKENGLLEKRYPDSIKFTEKKKEYEEYDFERCKKAYEQCTFVADVRKNYKKEYKIAKEKGWHKELKRYLCAKTVVLIPKEKIQKKVTKREKKSRVLILRKWSREACEEIVKKYTFLKDLVKNEPNVYNVIRRYQWNDLLSPLKRVQHAPYNYTLEEIKDICAPYRSLLELSKARKDIDNYCRKKGIDLYELNGWPNLRNRKVVQLLDEIEIATYPSISAAAKAINVPRNRMWEHVQSGEPYMGYIWKYKD